MKDIMEDFILDTGRRINNGFIRNNHNVFTISDRDIIHISKNLSDLKGIKSLNKKIWFISNL